GADGVEDCGDIVELLLAVFVDGCVIELLLSGLLLQAASELATTTAETMASVDCVMAFMLHSPIGCEGNTLPTALGAADGSSLRPSGLRRNPRPSDSRVRNRATERALYPAHHEQDDEHDDDDARDAARAITPIATVGPGRQGA